MKLRSILGLLVLLGAATPAFGQGYGTNAYNVLTPAAGGMAGVSLARPQDSPAAVFGNPATLTQFEGTRFTFGGSFTDATYTVTHDGTLSGGTPFSASSGTQGFAGGSIAAIVDLHPLGVPGAIGLGFGGLSGLGAEFRGLAPVGGNITNEYVVLGNNLSLGLELTDRLNFGASLTVGTAFAQMGLTQVSAMVHDYGLGGGVGFTYEATPNTTLGLWYQSELRFKFDNMFLLSSPPPVYADMRISQPDTIGLGLAHAMNDGRLLLAADMMFIEWDNSEMFKDVFVNQWVFAFGVQRTGERLTTRLGYSYNTCPVSHEVGANLSGFPIGQAAVQFFQASSLASINQHRITAGVGKQDYLFRGVDMDIFAGGLPETAEGFGTATSASVVCWYAGFGMTWRYHPQPVEKRAPMFGSR